MRTLTRALQRHSHHRTTRPEQSQPAQWVNDEQFEILESGILDERIGTDALVLQFRRA